jgi:hypothetical protein
MASDKANNAKKSSDVESEEILNELRVIKPLLVILLAKLGSDSGEIGKALRAEPRRIRDWISFNEVERVFDKKGKGRKRGVEEADVEVNPVMEERESN